MKKLLSLLLALCMVFPLLGSALAIEPTYDRELAYKTGDFVNEIIISGVKLTVRTYEMQSDNDAHGLSLEYGEKNANNILALTGIATAIGTYTLKINYTCFVDGNKTQTTENIRLVIEAANWYENTYDFTAKVNHIGQCVLPIEFADVVITHTRRCDDYSEGCGYVIRPYHDNGSTQLALEGMSIEPGVFKEKYTFSLAPKKSIWEIAPVDFSLYIIFTIVENPSYENTFSVEGCAEKEFCTPLFPSKDVEILYTTYDSYDLHSLHLTNENDMFNICGSISLPGNYQMDVYYNQNGKLYISRIDFTISESLTDLETYDLTVNTGSDVDFVVLSGYENNINDAWLVSDNDAHGLTLKRLVAADGNCHSLRLVGTACNPGTYQLKAYMNVTPRDCAYSKIYCRLITLTIKDSEYSSETEFTLVSGENVCFEPFQCKKGYTYKTYRLDSDKDGYELYLKEEVRDEGYLIYLSGTVGKPGDYTLLFTYACSSGNKFEIGCIKITLHIREVQNLYNYSIITGNAAELLVAEYDNCVAYSDIEIIPEISELGLTTLTSKLSDNKSCTCLYLSGTAGAIGTYKFIVSGKYMLSSGEIRSFANFVAVTVHQPYDQVYDYSITVDEEVNLMAFRQETDDANITKFYITPEEINGLTVERGKDGIYLRGTPQSYGDYAIDVYCEIETDGVKKTYLSRVNLHIDINCDVNCDGKVNTGDAAKLLQYCAKLCELNEEQLKRGDYNCDGKVNTGDAAGLLRFLTWFKR